MARRKKIPTSEELLADARRQLAYRINDFACTVAEARNRTIDLNEVEFLDHLEEDKLVASIEAVVTALAEAYVPSPATLL